MRVPVKSETDAFRIAYGFALLVGISVAVGAAATPLAGVAVLAGGLVGAVGVELSFKDPDHAQPLREASRSMPLEEAGASARPRVLVVANQTVGGDELKAEILGRGGPRPELRIVVPVRCSRAQYLTSDIDREIAAAGSRLDAMLGWAGGQGYDARGAIGDANPLLAIEDELRRFGADELIISTHPPERSHWLEAGVVERAREELDIPVTHVVVDLAAQAPRKLAA
jgi:hypothetical protein